MHSSCVTCRRNKCDMHIRKHHELAKTLIGGAEGYCPPLKSYSNGRGESELTSFICVIDDVSNGKYYTCSF